MALCVDLRFGPDHDLIRVLLQNKILGLIQSGGVAFCHMGTPCVSWSRARLAPGRPQAPRSDDFVLGLLVLKYGSERHKVDLGNRTMDFKFYGY